MVTNARGKTSVGSIPLLKYKETPLTYFQPPPIKVMDGGGRRRKEEGEGKVFFRGIVKVGGGRGGKG